MTPQRWLETLDEAAGDAWGRALLDFHEGREVAELLLEVDDGKIVPAMDPAWFFRPHDEWDWWERQLLALIDDGPVLDLGAGAGRAALHLQDQGFDVTAVESSPGAAEVCRQRGVHDVRGVDLNDPPTDKPWRAVLLLCGNLGLGGSWKGNHRLLTRLAAATVPGGLLVGDSVSTEGRAEVNLRLRYGDIVGPWWRQRNVAHHEIPDLVADTGWVIERHLEDGIDHAVALRRLPWTAE